MTGTSGRTYGHLATRATVTLFAETTVPSAQFRTYAPAGRAVYVTPAPGTTVVMFFAADDPRLRLVREAEARGEVLHGSQIPWDVASDALSEYLAAGADDVPCRVSRIVPVADGVVVEAIVQERGSHRMFEVLHIITPVGRPDHLPRLGRSLAASGLCERFWVVWWQMFNGPVVGDALGGAHMLQRHASPAPGLDDTGRPAYGHAQRSHALDLIGDGDHGWVWVLDDDNLVHSRMAEGLAALIGDYPAARGFVVGQRRADGASFPVGPMFCRPGYVDTAQYILRRDLIGAERVRPVYADDGGFIHRVVTAHGGEIVFTPQELCYHNAMDFIAEEG